MKNYLELSDMEVKGQKREKSQDTGRSAPFCQPCHRDGERQTADGFCKTCDEHLCKSCIKGHKKNKASASHILQDAGAMPKTALSKQQRPSGCVVPCPKHAGKMIEFLCEKHGVVVCSVCATIDHTACEKQYIPDVSDQFVQGTGFKCKLGKMDSLLQYCIDSENATQTIDEVMHQTCDQALQNIDDFRNKIDSALDKWQGRMKKAVENVRQTSSKKLASVLDTTTHGKTTLSSLRSEIDTLISSGQNDRVVVELFQAMAEVDNQHSFLTKLPDTTIESSAKFVPNINIQRLIKTEEKLGDLEKSFTQVEPYVDKKEPPASSNVKRKSLSLVKNIHVKTKEDEKDCWITSMVELLPGTLMLADYVNHAIKLLDTDAGTVISRHACPVGPYGITRLDDIQQVAVTLPGKGIIQVMSADKRFNKVRTVKVDLCCCGIGYARGKLVVTWDHPKPRCQILSLQGQVCYTYADNVGLPSDPHYIAVSKEGRYILVSHNKDGKVLKLAWEGGLESEYSDAELERPCGLLTRNDGSFYVCGKSSIHHVSGNCTKLAIVLPDSDKMKRPQFMCIDSKEIMYVSYNSDADAFSDFIKVYT